MRASASWEIRVLSEVAGRDAGSVTGKNIINMQLEFNKDPREMTFSSMKSALKLREVPAGEGWVLDHLKDMLIERQEMVEEGEVGVEFDLLQ